MKMFRILAAALAALVTPTLLPSAAAEPVVLERGNGAEPDTLDPQKATGSWENNIIGDMIVGLMTDDAEGNPIPGMAESYTVSPDGLVWTFKLRADAVWSDGVPVTAEDFVFAFQRINDPATGGQYATITHVIKNAAKVYAQELPPGDIGAKALDPKTLELTLEHPASYLPAMLVHYAFFPVPKHAVEKFGNDWVKPGNYVSNGAFTLVSWKPNDKVILKKSPTFYDAANVAIDEVQFYAQDDQIANTKRFRAGELDLSAGIPGQLLDELRRTMPEKVRLAPFITNWFVTFNLTRPEWQDARVRNALGLAIDRETIVKQILRGGETPAYTFVHPDIPGYPHTAKLFYADMPMAERQKKARELLAEAGFGPDNPLKFEFLHPQSTDAKRIATALQGMWKAVGVEMTPAGSEAKTVYANLRQQNFAVGLSGWIADFPDASSFLYLAKTSSDEMNYGKYSNAKFDQLNIDGDNEPDAAKRGALLAEAEQILLDDAPVVPIYNAVSRYLVQPYVKGFENALTNVHRTRWMSIDAEARAAMASPTPDPATQTADASGKTGAAPTPDSSTGMLLWWLMGGGVLLALAGAILARRRKPA
jgi:oligopeptide transport system substrate-binding protein